MLERRITLGATTVLHARPVAEIVRLAREFGGDVRLHAPGQEAVDAASILAMMTLVMGPGATVMVTATGAGAEEVLAAIERVLSEG